MRYKDPNMRAYEVAVYFMSTTSKQCWVDLTSDLSGGKFIDSAPNLETHYLWDSWGVGMSHYCPKLLTR